MLLTMIGNAEDFFVFFFLAFIEGGALSWYGTSVCK